MSARFILISAAGAALLAACATSTNNPNYQYSTKYKGSNPYTTVASSETQVTAAPVIYAQPPGSETVRQPISAGYETVRQPLSASYTRVDEQCLQAGAVVPCHPQIIDISHTHAVIAPAYTAPTDRLYADQEMTGTPGYHAVQSSLTEYAYPETVTPAPVEIPPAAVTEAVTIPTPTPLPYMSQHGEGGTIHTVVEGDTVYSFARRLCTSLEEIQQLNGIDGTFTIRVDDTIRLPASRC